MKLLSSNNGQRSALVERLLSRGRSVRWSSLTSFVAAVAIFVLTGCKTIPAGRSAVDDVAVRGTDKLDDGDVLDKIATTKTSKFLGIKQGFLYEYSTFDRFVFQRDLARVEAYYRSKGYWDAHARAGRVRQVSSNHVEVEILVEEGEPVVLRGIKLDGADGLPSTIVRQVNRAAYGTLKKDQPFDEDLYEKAAGDARRALSDRGYAYAKVERDAALDLVKRQADVVFTITPGPLCDFGGVFIEGEGKLPKSQILRAADISEGKPFSEAELDSAQQAILDLNVFASVAITPDLPTPPKSDHPRVDVHIKVEPTRLRTIKLGGGLEFDALKSDVHGVIGWEHKNFLGGLRNFQVELRPGVVLYPLRVSNIVVPSEFFPEERLRVELRQPGLFEARTAGFIRPELDTYAVLIRPDPDPKDPVLGYIESRNSVGADRTFGPMYVAVTQNVQYDVPFSYANGKNPNLTPLLISYPELQVALDFRDDKVHPRKGIFLSGKFQYAGGPFFGDARDFKVQPEARFYVPIFRKLVLAVRGTVGLLYPSNYGSFVENRPPTDPATEAARTHDYQLTFFRGFFSGGPTSNRGYPLRGVGPQDVVPFLSPETSAQEVNNNCSEKNPNRAMDKNCLSPTGGFTLWEASVELRFTVQGPLSIATFCDASDVSPHQTDIRLDRLHLSCGPGVRYDTPVGPIRLDLGFRIPGLQYGSGGVPADEKEPGDFFGIPLAVAFGIGESF